MKLSDDDKLMLDGGGGEGVRLSMSIVVRMAEVQQAAELMDVTQAHIAGCGLLSEVGVAFAERLVAGGASVATTPLSLWGGLDPATGNIPDRRHELCGQCMTGRVFVLPSGKGSSTASAILAESIRSGTAPAAIILAHTDPIIALGAIVADEMFGRTVPVVVLDKCDYDAIAEGDQVTVQPDGTVLAVSADGEKGTS